MAIDFPVSEALIRQHSSSDSFDRGLEYYGRRAVRSVIQRNGAVDASVAGSGPVPYEVHVSIEGFGFANAGCTCPYDYDGWCKHIVAVLLTCLHEPQAVESFESLDAATASLNDVALRQVLLSAAMRSPAAAAAIGTELSLLDRGDSLPDDASRTGPQLSPVDVRAMTRAVYRALHSLDRMGSSQAYWHVGEVVEEVRGLLDDVTTRLDAADPGGALALLEAFTLTYMDQWETLDDSDGEAGAFFDDLGSVWAEVLLSAEQLSGRERQAWASKLEAWADELESDYGVGEGFMTAAVVADRGWRDPALRAILEGTLPRDPRLIEDLLAEPAAVTVARLRVLARQGKFEAYVRLADVLGQSEACAAMLVRLGRLDQALQYALNRLESPAGALGVAKQFHNEGDGQAAMTIAEHGLTLNGSKAELAAWLHEVALTEGRTETALAAAIVGFKEAPALFVYENIQRVSGVEWDRIREELLHFLRTHAGGPPAGVVDVFLREGLLDDAIDRVRGRESWDYRVTERIAEAAVEVRPDWVMALGREQAESIINAGRSELYGTAARWLSLARTAMRFAGQESAWQEHLAALTLQHRRKYKLLPMLKALAR